MNITKDAMYCRLCAEIKQHHTLINLQTDEETCQKVVNRLSRFNIIMDFQENILPKTVCLLCVKSLERAFVFVTAVEQAQAFLSDFILVQINTAASYSCDENMLCEPPDNKNGIIDIKDEPSQDSMEVNDDGTNLSEKCHSEVMTEVNNGFDYSMINGNTEEHIIENKHDIQASNEMIEVNTDFKVETRDLYHAEDNKNISKDIFEKELNSEPILLCNTVCADYINKQNYSNEVAKNMDKSVQQLQPQEYNSKHIPSKQLATIVYSKTNINKTQNPKENKQKNSKISTKNTDTDVEHIKMSWKEYEWKCYYCETLFPIVEELQKHSMQYHNSCNPYQCTDCVKRCSNLNRFIKHVRRHKKYLIYSCYQCLKKFPKPYQVRQHKKRIHEDSDYVCSGCNTPFHSNRELKEHVNKYFKQLFLRKTLSDLSCSLCNKNTANAKDLHKHLLSHQNKKENHVCETCGKCFVLKQQLRQHMIIHSAVKILHSCDVCNASFTRVSKLRYHKSIHSGIKPFICDHCGKSFRTKAYVARHMNTHMDSVLCPCTLCNKKFRSASYLKLHMLQHTGEKPYSCALCQRDFTNWSNYNKHMKRRHATDMAKTKRTPVGTYPVDPVTGEVVVPTSCVENK